LILHTFDGLGVLTIGRYSSLPRLFLLFPREYHAFCPNDSFAAKVELEGALEMQEVQL
jgi:hypothetical protein